MKQLMIQLAEVRFSQLRLRLELQEAFRCDLPALLQLRRELRQAIDLLSLQGDAELTSRLQRLLKPAVFFDPVARRRFRQPSPAFVFACSGMEDAQLQAGEELHLPFTLWGRGRSQLPDLLRLFDALGQIGLHHGQGRFRLMGLEAVSGSGDNSLVWNPGVPINHLEIPYNDLAWWLDQRPAGSDLLLRFLTPARILSGNRPLFRPKPAELVAAMLRRVTSMIYTWSEIELPIEPRQMMTTAAGLHSELRGLTWHDWRRLDQGGSGQELGGLLGELRLGGAGLADIGWVLQLCELFNLGRWAAYGGGCCRVFWS